jgi:hypothetical protein
LRPLQEDRDHRIALFGSVLIGVWIRTEVEALRAMERFLDQAAAAAPHGRLALFVVVEPHAIAPSALAREELSRFGRALPSMGAGKHWKRPCGGCARARVEGRARLLGVIESGDAAPNAGWWRRIGAVHRAHLSAGRGRAQQAQQAAQGSPTAGGHSFGIIYPVKRAGAADIE